MVRNFDILITKKHHDLFEFVRRAKFPELSPVTSAQPVMINYLATEAQLYFRDVKKVEFMPRPVLTVPTLWELVTLIGNHEKYFTVNVSLTTDSFNFCAYNSKKFLDFNFGTTEEHSIESLNWFYQDCMDRISA